MTKGNLVGGTEQTQPPAKQEKQAVTTTQSAAIKAIIQRNAYTSPLLKLPGEIREKIFSLVVGHQFVHLLYSQTRGKIRHTVCTARASEDEVYEQFMTGNFHLPSYDATGYLGFGFKDRHPCWRSWDRDEEGRVRWDNVASGRVSTSMAVEELPKPMLDLSLLGVCRQAYEEANFLLWTTNTFSFESDVTFLTFINSLHSTQREKLKRLHFDLAWDSLIQDGHILRVRDCISGLTGLRTFHATLRPNRPFIERELPPFLYQMQKLPLQHVTVVIGEGMYLGDDTGPITERREMAKNLRSKLLGPNGPGVLAAERKAEEEEAEREKMKGGKESQRGSCRVPREMGPIE